MTPDVARAIVTAVQSDSAHRKTVANVTEAQPADSSFEQERSIEIARPATPGQLQSNIVM